MNLSAYAQPLINFLHLHPHSAGIITFFIVFCEAMAVIGVIIPGSITMTAIGVLVGSNVIPAGSTFAWAIAGAILGDEISYLLGVYYQDRLHRIWPFKKHPQLLEKSEVFFKKHGGKSVFLGRFIGPMRAMMPMVAGMFKMPQGRFLVAAVPSAAMWAVGYIIPGVLLGALSLELPPKVATQFLLAILAIIIALWIVTWLAHHFAKRIYRWYDKYVMNSWLFMQQHRSLCWFTNLLNDPREPENHTQLSLFLLAIVSVLIFTMVFASVAMHGVLTKLDSPLYNLLLSLRIPFFDHIMVAFTLIGEEVTLIGASVLLLLWLLYKRYWYIAGHWFAALLLSVTAIFAVKGILFSPRPGGMENFQHTSSFPSGHVMLSLAIAGFWSVIVARELPRERRWIPYAGAGVIVALVALSRLYLGAHWLTDVVGSLLLGTVVVLVLTISYRRRHTLYFFLPRFVLTSVIMLLVVAVCYGSYSYSKKIYSYSLKCPQQTIALADWSKEVGTTIPLYRLNRLGKPIQAFNVEWAGSLDKIEEVLLKRGWVKQPISQDLHDVILNLAGDSMASHFPLFPQLYHNRHMALLMMKETEQNHVAVVLRLWQSDIMLQSQNSILPLWLGVVDYHYANHNLFKIPLKDSNSGGESHRHKFDGATETLGGYMEDFQWQKTLYPKEKLPAEMQELDWNRWIFLVRPR